VSVALSAVITLAVLQGIGKVAETQSAAYPEMLARTKAREAAKAAVSVASGARSRVGRRPVVRRHRVQRRPCYFVLRALASNARASSRRPASASWRPARGGACNTRSK
jgi:hypothetical protein